MGSPGVVSQWNFTSCPDDITFGIGKAERIVHGNCREPIQIVKGVDGSTEVYINSAPLQGVNNWVVGKYKNMILGSKISFVVSLLALCLCAIPDIDIAPVVIICVALMFLSFLMFLKFISPAGAHAKLKKLPGTFLASSKGGT